MEIHFAKENELAQVNRLRKQVNDLHANGKPEFFRQGFSEELQNYIYKIYEDSHERIVVCKNGETVCAFAILSFVFKPESQYTNERKYLEINEFGVDENCRRQGIAAKMIDFIRDFAKHKGFERIELNMWEFNSDALAFYEAVGFSTYRRYMELKL